MHPETHLEVLAAILGFLLKTSLGFCVSWLISKVIVPPNRKFTLWFAWLSIAGAYWLWLLATLVPHPSLSAFPHPPALLAAAPIRFYRRFLSPLKPPSCRFQPTCSEYALEAIAMHGAARGFVLALRRILRCHPITWLGGASGYDPVPASKSPIPKASSHDR